MNTTSNDINYTVKRINPVMTTFRGAPTVVLTTVPTLCTAEAIILGRLMLKNPVALVVDWLTVAVTPRILVQFYRTSVPLMPWSGQFPVDVQQSWPVTLRPVKTTP
ncbi:hypothetical protein Salat_1147000 [Sesamum alatum]|uniref:Uncharacterized protein n=1 Tax=Sesamum alatum TaxID=300844 RepID=A0AAE1YE94_9LAMI|nr:hypothetical protein Salat_1147000 [Sesamum alatum]